MSCSEEVFRKIAAETYGEPGYLDTVHRFLLSLRPAIDYSARPDEHAAILQRLLIPQKEVSFNVYWTDDEDHTHTTPAWRVEYCSALGPCKGGNRMRENVSLDQVKATGLDTLIRGTLTGQRYGGAKGGAAFNPEKHSGREVRSFFRSFVRELYSHIDPDEDILTPDVGMEGRIVEIFLDEYRNYTDRRRIPLVGRLPEYGGSPLKRVGVGYGVVLLARAYLRDIGIDIRNLKIIVSGAGSVGIAAIEKAQQLGAKVVACSDTMGWVYDPDGIDVELLKTVKFGRKTDVRSYAARRPHAEFHEGRGVWTVTADLGFPCAVSGEIDLENATAIADSGIRYLCSGAFSPFTWQAEKYLRAEGITILPSRMSTAGGIAVTGIEADALARGVQLTREEYEAELFHITEYVLDTVSDTAKRYDLGNDYTAAADITAYQELARAIRRDHSFPAYSQNIGRMFPEV